MIGATGARQGVEWLAAAAPDPEACLREWRDHPLGVALLPAGVLWDVLVVTGPLGRTALRVLLRTLDRPGPVLADFGASRTGFFVPPGAAVSRAGAHVRAAGRGSWIVTPYPGRRTGGVRWLVAPDGRGTLTDPRDLDRALHEAAAPAEQYGGHPAR